MTDSQLYTVSRPSCGEIRVRRSRFLGSLMPASHRQAAEDHIAKLRETYHDATHNCFAYRIDDQAFRYSDDGEPSGTAGKPILSMLEKYHIWQCVLVVTRYFGGVKLGTGGLMRAYSKCAEETIKNSQLKKFVRYQQYHIQYPYNLSRNMQYLASKYDCVVDDSQFAEAVATIVSVPLAGVEAFLGEVRSISGGMVEIEPLPDSEDSQ